MGLGENLPELPVPACSFDFVRLGYKPGVEVFTTNRQVSYMQQDNLALASDGESLMGVLCFDYCQTELAMRTQTAYRQIFAACESHNYPFLIRMWNVFPGINQIDETGMERYRAFCQGRALAFLEGRHAELQLPAGTGVGSNSGPVSLVFMASRQQSGINLENPQQMPAYHYPRQYGPKSPSFARATQVTRPGGTVIYVSGTSSIRGHETVFSGDIEKQTRTTLNNINVLVGSKNLSRFGIEGHASVRELNHVKVYIRHAQHAKAVQALCEDYLNPKAQVIYVGAQLCRADLLVEIEGMVV